jgi:hypothetical protein
MPRSKKYSINYLLSKQPLGFKKHKDFHLLISYFESSDILKCIRIPQKAFTILNKLRVSSDKLNYFYKVFRIPKNSFFPVFLKIKSDYLKNKLKVKTEKLNYIKKIMNILNEDVIVYLKYFITYEKAININRRTPVWNKFFLPKSKKKADEFFKYNKHQWINIFFDFIDTLNNYYNWIDKVYGRKLVALFIMELNIEKHSQDKLKSQFRLLSKKFHPDAGGDAKSFNELLIAKKILID